MKLTNRTKPNLFRNTAYAHNPAIEYRMANRRRVHLSVCTTMSVIWPAQLMRHVHGYCYACTPVPYLLCTKGQSRGCRQWLGQLPKIWDLAIPALFGFVWVKTVKGISKLYRNIHIVGSWSPRGFQTHKDRKTGEKRKPAVDFDGERIQNTVVAVRCGERVINPLIV